MYHRQKNFSVLILSLNLAITQVAAGSNAAYAGKLASDLLATKTTTSLAGKVGVAHQEFSKPPMGKALKKSVRSAHIYEFDETPLGNRQPFLLVHGLRGEFYRTFRWTKVATNFSNDPTFNKKYKIYLLRYSTLVPLADSVPQFREQINGLSEECDHRPITITALSIGGNLVYEGMLDKKTDSQVRLVMTLGTPFHGSPLFTRNWVQYSIYKNFAMPWTRVDHSLAFRFYFHHNPNLEKDLPWDNTDHAIPEVGRFYSWLPLGPSGTLTVENSENKYLAAINLNPVDKKKFITYSGYLLNPYMRSEPMRIAETTLLAPYTVLAMKVPAHFAREHAVLKMLNCVIGSVVVAKPAVGKAKTPFLYQLNDGITPVNSAIFLSNNVLGKTTAANESSLAGLKKLTDVRQARVFRNIDHLTFIDGFRPSHSTSLLRDELDPEGGSKNIFNWMLSDILEQDKTVNSASSSEPPPSQL
jgi:hypothetical protein